MSYYSGIGVNGRRDPVWRGIYDSQAQLLNDQKTQQSAVIAHLRRKIFDTGESETEMAPVETEAIPEKDNST